MTSGVGMVADGSVAHIMARKIFIRTDCLYLRLLFYVRLQNITLLTWLLLIASIDSVRVCVSMLVHSIYIHIL